MRRFLLVLSLLAMAQICKEATAANQDYGTLYVKNKGLTASGTVVWYATNSFLAPCGANGTTGPVAMSASYQTVANELAAAWTCETGSVGIVSPCTRLNTGTISDLTQVACLETFPGVTTTSWSVSALGSCPTGPPGNAGLASSNWTSFGTFTCYYWSWDCPYGGELNPNVLTNGDPTCQFGGVNAGPMCEGSASGNPANTSGTQTSFPIHVATGNKLLIETDIAPFGANKLKWVRYYNSQGSSPAPTITPQWTFSYGRSLQPETPTWTTVYRPDGSIRTARPVGSAVASGAQVWSIDTAKPERVSELFDSNLASVGWIVYAPNEGTEEKYGASGNLQSISDLSGYTRTVSYSDGTAATGVVLNPDGSSTTSAIPAGYPVAVTDSFGRSISFGYDGSLRIIKVTDPSQQNYLYSFDANSNLTSVLYPDAGLRQYVYNEATLSQWTQQNALTGIIDENGQRFASYSYDSAGRATNSTWWADSALTVPVNSTTVAYTNPSNSVVTDALGTARTIGLTTNGNVYLSTGQSQPGGAGCGPAASSRSYDANGNVSTEIDFDGNVACFSSDLTRNVQLARLEGVGVGGVCPTSLAAYVPLTGTPQRLIQSKWHPTFNLKVAEAGPLKITYWIYNGQPDPTNGGLALGCAPSTALLPDGNPIAVLCKRVEEATTDASGGSGFGAGLTGTPRIWTYTYNQWGQVLTETGPRGNLATTDPNFAPATTTYTYYAATDTAHTPPSYQMGDLQQVTDAVGHVTQFPQYDGNGRLLQQVDPNGATTIFGYSLRGWLLTRTVTPPGASSGQQTTYAYDSTGQLRTVTQPDNSQLAYTYDDAHRLTTVTDSAGDTISYTLDPIGNRTQEKMKDPAGNLSRQISRVYDALNRLQTVTGALQ